MMTYEQEILWLAGLLEGEGYFCTERNKKYQCTAARLTLCMSDGDVIERAAKIMGASRIRKYKPKNFKAQHKDIFHIRISGEKAASIMRQILPFMGNRRKAKIEEVLKAHQSRSTWSDGAKRRVERQKRGNQAAQLFVMEQAS